MAKRTGFTFVAFVAGLCSACGGSVTPTSPTPTSATPPSSSAGTFAVRGTVTGYQGASLSDATLEILDGVNQGQQAVTDVQGRYTFARLQGGEFTVRASAVDYATATKSVALTTDTSLEFQLRLLLAEFVVVGALTTVNNPDGTITARGQSSNTGDGCAAQVSGTANFRDSNRAIVTTLAWSLPPNTIVRPGERISYEFCCVTREQAALISSYDADFRGITVRCS